MNPDRRHFLKMILAGAGAAALQEAIPFNRVWFIPKTVELYTPQRQAEFIGRLFYARYDVTPAQIEAAQRGEITVVRYRGRPNAS